MAESKSSKMARDLLENEGCAFIVMSHNMALIGPGAPFSISPTPTYSENDLYDGVEQGLFQKKTWNVHDHTGKTSPLEVWVLASRKK
jgi:hypothetical protein